MAESRALREARSWVDTDNQAAAGARDGVARLVRAAGGLAGAEALVAGELARQAGLDPRARGAGRLAALARAEAARLPAAAPRVAVIGPDAGRTAAAREELERAGFLVGADDAADLVVAVPPEGGWTESHRATLAAACRLPLFSPAALPAGVPGRRSAGLLAAARGQAEPTPERLARGARLIESHRLERLGGRLASARGARGRARELRAHGFAPERLGRSASWGSVAGAAGSAAALAAGLWGSAGWPGLAAGLGAGFALAALRCRAAVSAARGKAAAEALAAARRAGPRGGAAAGGARWLCARLAAPGAEARRG